MATHCNTPLGNRSRTGWGLVRFSAERRTAPNDVGRKHGPVPFRGAEGDSPIFAAKPRSHNDVRRAAKIGTVPCERLPPLGRLACHAILSWRPALGLSATSSTTMTLDDILSPGTEPEVLGERLRLYRRPGRRPRKGTSTSPTEKTIRSTTGKSASRRSCSSTTAPTPSA